MGIGAYTLNFVFVDPGREWRDFLTCVGVFIVIPGVLAQLLILRWPAVYLSFPYPIENEKDEPLSDVHTIFTAYNEPPETTEKEGEINQNIRFDPNLRPSKTFLFHTKLLGNPNLSHFEWNTTPGVYKLIRQPGDTSELSDIVHRIFPVILNTHVRKRLWSFDKPEIPLDREIDNFLTTVSLSFRRAGPVTVDCGSGANSHHRLYYNCDTPLEEYCTLRYFLMAFYISVE
jgi:hypothetical protein